MQLDSNKHNASESIVCSLVVYNCDVVPWCKTSIDVLKS